MTRTLLVIIGAGGFGREVHDVVEAINEDWSTAGTPRYKLVGFIDDGEPDMALLDERGATHLGGLDALDELDQETRYVIGIGNGAVRRKIDRHATGLGLEAATLIHPRATLGRHLIQVGAGGVICAGVVLTTNIRLGRHVHLNLNVTVGHEAVIGDYVSIFPGATISGTTVIQDEVTIGTGAAVIPGVTIGAGSTIGAAASVVRDIPAGVIAVGVPAKSR